MSYSDEFAGTVIVASRGDNMRAATQAQAGAVAGQLGKLIERALASALGLSVGKPLLREIRIALLNHLFGDATYPTIRYGG